MNKLTSLTLTPLLLAPLAVLHAASSIVTILPADSGPLKFAAVEIERAAKAAGVAVPSVSLRVEAGAKEAYRIERGADGVITVIGGDATGAMYGGLDVAETVRLGTLGALKPGAHQPHIARRGIKFNIPLDLRTPSYSDCSDAAQANAAIRDTHYVPALYNRVGYVDVTALTEKVTADLDIARNWKPGTLKDDGKRAGTERGFRR